MNLNDKELIPHQNQGSESNVEQTVEFESIDEAKAFYDKAKERLLNVNNWHKISGKLTADFELTDEKGNKVERRANERDHFKIDIPGPGTVTGEGFDWVQIEKIDEINNQDEDHVAIRVRPATNPKNERTDVAHFFSNEATSSFIVKREDNKVIAGVYGRNEKPNTHTETVVDKARNATVATGAVSGVAKLQWKSLVAGILKQD